MGVGHGGAVYAPLPALSPDLAQFLTCLDIPFHSPMDRAMKIAHATDNAVAQAALLPRLGDFAGSIAAHRAALAKPRTGQHDRLILESLIQMLDREPSTTVSDARAVRQEWWRRFGVASRPITTDRNPERPIRLGIVSSNFKHSSAGNCLEAILFNFSDAIEVIGYSTSTAGLAVDPMALVFQSRLTLVDASKLSEHALAERMRADGIDIAVDCMGFTYGNRLVSFAERVAPIQITGWGYATGTIPAMDWILLDPITAGNDQFFERVLHAPCVISYLPPMDLICPAVAPLPTGPVTFGAFHCFIKINDDVLRVWKQILDRVPGSRIVFKGKEYGETALQDRITAVLGADRCEFWPTTQQMQHFDAFRHIDLVLDPWPQTGGITTCEALHMGVPSVTLMGERTIQRAAAAILASVNLWSCVAKTPAEYVDRAVSLVNDRAWLAEQRRTLRGRLAASPICSGYTAAVEALFRSLWREYCAKESCI